MGGIKAGVGETPPSLNDPPSFFSPGPTADHSGPVRLDRALRRRHRSMLNDLATTMPGASAGAAFSGSGADHELRRRFERYDDSRESKLNPRNQRMRRTPANDDPVGIP